VPIGDTAGMPAEKRVDFDLEAYVERVRTGPCFVCAIARGDPSFPAHVVFRDEHHMAFLPNFHVLLGYVLVAPIEHREAVVGDFSLEEYLELHRVVHRVARALEATVPTERVYVLSLGSQQGNAHVHWHVAALPPGVPYDEQQFRALMVETKGVLALTADEQADLADRLRAAVG
jgi:histidine triad (HIT) family protein